LITFFKILKKDFCLKSGAKVRYLLLLSKKKKFFLAIIELVLLDF